VLAYIENMDYSKTTLLANSSHTPAPMPVNYPLQEAHPGYNRLPSIPENVVHPPHSDTRQVFQQPSYEVVEMPPPPQPVQVTAYTGGIELNQLNLHSSIGGETLWFNLNLAKVCLINLFSSYFNAIFQGCFSSGVLIVICRVS